MCQCCADINILNILIIFLDRCFFKYILMQKCTKVFHVNKFPFSLSVTIKS